MRVEGACDTHSILCSADHTAAKNLCPYGLALIERKQNVFMLFIHVADASIQSQCSTDEHFH